MDPPQKQTARKVNKDNMEAPRLPCRSKSTQKVKRKQGPNSTVIISKSNDDAASDTDSGYEYVANPMKERNRSAVVQFSEEHAEYQPENCEQRRGCKGQQKQPNTIDNTKDAADADDTRVLKSGTSPLNESVNGSNKSKKPNQEIAEACLIHENMPIRDSKKRHSVPKPMIHEGNIYAEDTQALKGRHENNDSNEAPFKCSESRKVVVRSHLASADSITREGKSQQDTRYLHSGDKTNDSYDQLINQAMEPTSNKHEYQKLNKLTMEPRLPVIVNTKRKPQCSEDRHNTI